jgi:hypothetical protein
MPKPNLTRDAPVVPVSVVVLFDGTGSCGGVFVWVPAGFIGVGDGRTSPVGAGVFGSVVAVGV